MAARSGRRGEFPPDLRELLQLAILQEVDDEDSTSMSPQKGTVLENAHPNAERHFERQKLSTERTSSEEFPSGINEPRRSSKTASPAPVAPSIVIGEAGVGGSPSSGVVVSDHTCVATSGVQSHEGEGCRACGRDNDHANLLLCEACNDEYHTYCLKPPLQSVPEGDFFCGTFLP